MKVLLCVFVAVFFIACGDTKDPKTLFAIELENQKTQVKKNEQLSVSIKNEEKRNIKTVNYFIDGKELTLTDGKLNFNIEKLGNKVLIAKINFDGPIRMMQVVLPQMRRQKEGLVINISSIAGGMGLPYRGVYSATKGALSIATEALRMETKDFGIQITDLAPGDFATNIAAGRYHSPNETSAYPAYSNVLKMINDDVDAAQNPIEVAKKVYAIITNSNPKVHYKVGTFMQKFSLTLKRILPDTLYEKLLLNHYKL